MKTSVEPRRKIQYFDERNKIKVTYKAGGENGFQLKEIDAKQLHSV